MKKYIFLILLLTVISCDKEKTSDSNLINFEDTILENTSDCFIEKKEIPNWQKTSYELFDINIPSNYQDLGGLGAYGVNTISVDYNNDGFDDIIGFYNDYSNFIDYPEDYFGYERKKLIRFFKGNCMGNFEIDEKNDKKFLGLVHGRKVLLGDFNKDGYVDVFFVGHGYDRRPFNGEFNKVLMSEGDNNFYEIDYYSFESFYHGGASGDIDNDGDLDIIVVDGGRRKSLLFENINGELIPNKAVIDQDLMNGMYNAELYDINNDGFLDLITGGHDWKGNQNPDCEWWECNTYNNTPVIIYGDGIDFIGNEYVRLPETSIYKQGIVTNFEFYDFDGNGDVEIILTRTGDNMNETPGLPWDQSNFYKDWSIQVLELNGVDYNDVTSKYIDVYFGEEEPWIIFTKIKDHDNDGILEMYNSVNPYKNIDHYLEWKIIGGRLIKQ
tara:strand:+ start:2363 stop:3682 length:1320 start_codon:yes stop_codon:yes gene_type:complete